MQTKIMSIFTRTPLHVGCGSSVGAVDQPVARERHTGYPVIPGSSIKGVLADLWNEDPESVKCVETEKDGKKCVSLVRIENGEAHQLFGNDTAEKNASTGALLIGEGKLVAFPVRSAKGCWAWLTCPLVLGRLARDWRMADGAVPPECQKVEEGETCAGAALVIRNEGKPAAVFEEYPLDVKETDHRQNLEQVRSIHAIKSAEAIDKGVGGGLATAKKVATQIRENGFLGALAFAVERKKDGKTFKNPAHKSVFHEMLRHFISLGTIGITADVTDVDHLASYASQVTAAELRMLTEEAVAYMNYLRRYAKPGKDEQTAESEG